VRDVHGIDQRWIDVVADRIEKACGLGERIDMPTTHRADVRDGERPFESVRRLARAIERAEHKAGVVVGGDQIAHRQGVYPMGPVEAIQPSLKGRSRKHRTFYYRHILSIKMFPISARSSGASAKMWRSGGLPAIIPKPVSSDSRARRPVWRIHFLGSMDVTRKEEA
jgi:hypothetical protein